MTGKLTTHVLDTASGKPAAGMRIELHRLEAAKKIPLADRVTNRDGRTDEALLSGKTMVVGQYRLLFHVAKYFAAMGSADAGKFLDVVPILFALMMHQPPIMCHYLFRRGLIQRIEEAEGKC